MAKQLDPNHPRAELARRMDMIVAKRNRAVSDDKDLSSSPDRQVDLEEENAALKYDIEKLKADYRITRKKLQLTEAANKESRERLIQSEKSREQDKLTYHQGLERANVHIYRLTGDLDRTEAENTDLRNEINTLKLALSESKEKTAVLESGVENMIDVKKPEDMQPVRKVRKPQTHKAPEQTHLLDQAVAAKEQEGIESDMDHSHCGACELCEARKRIIQLEAELQRKARSKTGEQSDTQ